MRELVFGCRKISPGHVTAEAVCSKEEILFYHADFEAGIITEKGHDLEGKSISGKIVVFPGGKGSSVVQADGLYNLVQNSKAPVGFIVRFLDTVLVSTAVVMEIPMVWKVDDSFWSEIQDGDLVKLDADHECVTIIRQQEEKMKDLILTGSGLTVEDVYQVAYEGRKVKIDEAAYARLARGRAVMTGLAEGGKAIYGLNRGVGWNKDRGMEESALAAYNRNLIRTHCLGAGPWHEDAEVRAMMCIRLNQILLGACCATDELADLYRDFLNHGITPQVPSRGSMGDDDIATLSHIGMAFIGEANVSYQGKIVSSKEAMEAEGIGRYVMELKDAHTVILSNAQGEAMTALLVKETEKLLDMSQLIYCLDYEGLNGNVEQMREEVNALRGLPGQIKCAAQCRKFLAGSYLYEPDEDRALQDALSFRDGFCVTGAVWDTLGFVRRFLDIQLNSTSDNPCVLPDSEETSVTANFETPTLAFGVEMLACALATWSKTIVHRMLRMTDPAFTHLTRYLAPWDNASLGFATIMNTYANLDAENRHLAMPSSMDFYSLEGGIEDRGTNLPYAAQKAMRILDNIRRLTGIEALYAAQAVDLRRQKKDIRLGEYTEKVYNTIRDSIPFFGEDRNMYLEMEAAYALIRSEKLLEII
ncbi:MAG: aromatic amino acid lyase [Lachnospiraceae bacterium]|nr:aromatic amino acid lyase [Lachnospiraceae bacterium]